MSISLVLLGLYKSQQHFRNQKTVVKRRGAQKARANSTLSTLASDRLVGILPVVADWHTKVKVLDVSCS